MPGNAGTAGNDQQTFYHRKQGANSMYWEDKLKNRDRDLDNHAAEQLREGWAKRGVKITFDQALKGIPLCSSVINGRNTKSGQALKDVAELFIRELILPLNLTGNLNSSILIPRGWLITYPKHAIGIIPNNSGSAGNALEGWEKTSQILNKTYPDKHIMTIPMLANPNRGIQRDVLQSRTLTPVHLRDSASVAGLLREIRLFLTIP